MSNLCCYKINNYSIEVKDDFKLFLSTRDDNIWTDHKNRVWKYVNARNTITSDVVSNLHPFVTNYDKENFISYINLHVYYLICTYVGTQLNLIDILNHAKNMLDFIMNKITADDIKTFSYNKPIMKIINLFVDNTKTLICYNRNETRGKQSCNDKEISDSNINIYNPNINILENENNDRNYDDPFIYDDDITKIHNVELPLSKTYEFYFIDDISTVSNLKKRTELFFATAFTIKSNAIVYANVNFFNENLYMNNSHIVTLFFMLSKDSSQSFLEIIQVSGCYNNATYVCLSSGQLYDTITKVLERLHYPFIVEQIVFRKEKNEPVLLIVFDEVKSIKHVNGDLLDITISITFSSE